MSSEKYNDWEERHERTLDKAMLQDVLSKKW